MSKFVGTGPWSYKKRIYRAAVSQRLRNTVLYDKLSLHNSLLLYVYDKNLSHFNLVRILRSLLFVSECHEQHIKIFQCKRKTSCHFVRLRPKTENRNWNRCA